MKFESIKQENIFRKYTESEIQLLSNEWGEEPSDFQNYRNKIEALGYSLDEGSDKQVLPSHTEDSTNIVADADYYPLRNLMINFYALPEEKEHNKYWIRIVSKVGTENRLSKTELAWQKDYDGKVIDQRFSKAGFEAYKKGDRMPESVTIDFDLVKEVFQEELRRKKNKYKAIEIGK